VSSVKIEANMVGVHDHIFSRVNVPSKPNCWGLPLLGEGSFKDVVNEGVPVTAPYK